MTGSDKGYNLESLDENAFLDKTFYKERWINEDGLEQRIIVTYSLKYRSYQRTIRNIQVERAIKTVENSPGKLKTIHQNDYKRFVITTSVTPDGEIASKNIHCVNTEIIAKEEAFDGFYAVCTNLEDDAKDIIAINHKRWEIEECFRIMKSELKAHPVYLSKDDRIAAHFTTCFLAPVLFRYLEKRLDQKFTCPEIIQGLRSMNFLELPGDGFLPTYTRSDLTDALHTNFGFRTDYQITKPMQMNKIFKDTKK